MRISDWSSDGALPICLHGRKFRAVAASVSWSASPPRWPRLSLSRARPGSGPAPAFQAAFRRSRCLARLRLPVEQLLFHLASTGRGGYQGYNDQPVRRFRAMNEEIFNMELRKFLKTVGVTSQRTERKRTRLNSSH